MISVVFLKTKMSEEDNPSQMHGSEKCNLNDWAICRRNQSSSCKFILRDFFGSN